MTGDMEALALYAGQVSGGIKEIRAAGDVVQDIATDARRVLSSLSSLA